MGRMSLGVGYALLAMAALMMTPMTVHVRNVQHALLRWYYEKQNNYVERPAHGGCDYLGGVRLFLRKLVWIRLGLSGLQQYALRSEQF